MSVEAHKCNVRGCKGFIVFENADFDYNNPPTVNGMYEFDDPSCTECGKEYKVVPYHAVIAIDEHEDIEFVESACITEYERREKERKYENEVDPYTKILMFLEQRRYSYTVQAVIRGYLDKQKSVYISHSIKDCVNHLAVEIKALLDKGNECFEKSAGSEFDESQTVECH